MNTPNTRAGVLSVFSIALSSLGRVSSPVDTAIMTSPPFNSSVHSGTGSGHHPSIEAVINCLEQKGVNVSQVKTALKNGDTVAVKAWFESYRQAHQGEIVDSAKQQQRLQTFITHLEQKGVNVSQLKTALQNSDTAAMKAWFEASRQEHMKKIVNHPQQLDPQKIITRLEGEGVDVSQVKTALQYGDTATVNAWLKSYFESHKGETATHRPCGHTQATKISQQL